MLNSLRFRLWLTYAILVLLVLCVVGTAITLVIYRGNIPLLQAALNLQTLRSNALPRLRSAGDLNPRLLQAVLNRYANQFRGRIVVINARGRVIADTLGEDGTSLPDFGTPPLKTEVGALPEFYQDDEGRSWYYIIDEINQNRWVFFAVSRPQLRIVTIFRDQFLRPLVLAGLVALLVAIILSLLMSRWISAPIRQISQEAMQLAEGQAQPIVPEGPAEVRQLAIAFNDMSQHVQESQQSQKDFVANVSHELKTPLTSIQGFARAIKDGTVQTKTELSQAADVIESEAQRMNRLVQDLLTLAKMDAGTARFEMHPFELNPLIQALIQKFKPLMDTAKIDFQAKPPEEEVRINGDPDQLMQVFDNLLDNAIKFTPSGGKIRLYCQKEAQKIAIHVVDSGEGIPVAEQKRIFERFYQVDKARVRGQGHGYGLGLAICKQILERHGGSISLTSIIGEGSDFVVKLPLYH